MVDLSVLNRGFIIPALEAYRRGSMGMKITVAGKFWRLGFRQFKAYDSKRSK
jgi:hypothetical protein